LAATLAAAAAALRHHGNIELLANIPGISATGLRVREIVQTLA